MNITEFMSFDLAWFTTLPGILITAGVVVLLIALIVLIVASKKDKKKKPEVASAENNSGMPNDPNLGSGLPLNDMAAVPTMPLDNNMVVDNSVSVQPMGMDNVSPIDSSMNNNMGMYNNVDIPTVNSPVAEVPQVPSYDSPAVATNVVDFSAPAQPIVNNDVAVLTIDNPVDNNVSIPGVMNSQSSDMNTPINSVATEQIAVPTVNNDVVVTPTVMPEVSAPTVEATPVVPPVVPDIPAVAPVVPEATPEVAPEKPMIYGGVDPANTVATTVPEKPVIYGGANPLENTTTIPTVTIHEAYNMNSNAVQTTEAASVVPPVVPEPVISQAPVVPEAMPVTQPVMSSVTPQAPTPVMPSTMPMTGAEMFGSVDNNASSADAVSSSNEIETLEF